MAYDKNKNYQEEINKAVASGDYYTASTLEKERNEKIDGEGLSVAKTNNYNVPNGVNASTYNQYNQGFNQSEDSKNKDAESNNALANYKNTANGQMISDSTKSSLYSQFVVPSEVAAADAYLKDQLAKIQSGKTSYSDDVQGIMDKIANREKFSYDVDTDPLFQQALASAMNSGKTAMQDTIGQASALTGGYGSTYATTAGNQAYNSFIEDAYDNLPQYYQMALEAYQMEGDELYRQLDMYNAADDKEYNRNVTAYDATYQHRNRVYDEAYQQFRDSKSDAFGFANLEMAEYGQRVSDAYNYYNIASNEADKQYQRDYTSWQDSVNQAWQMMNMENSDWWNQTNFDEGVRQFNENQAFQDKWNQKNYDQTEDHFTRGQEFTASENQKNRDFQASEAEKDRNFTASENAKNRAASSKSGGTKQTLSSVPSAVTSFLEKATTNSQIDTYLGTQVMNGVITEEQAAQLVSMYSLPSLMDREWEMTFDGGENGSGGLDEDGRVKDPKTGKEYRLDELYKAILEENKASDSPLGHQEISDYLMQLQRNLGITKY